MQYVDLSFNIMPVLHPNGFALRWVWLDAGCLALMGGVLAKVFLRDLNRYPAYPGQRPEAGRGHGPLSRGAQADAGWRSWQTDKLSGAQPHSGGGGQ